MAFSWRNGYVLGMRFLAFAIVAIAIYVLVGSWMFSDWWYGLVWGGHFNLQYVEEGLGSLVDDYFGIAIAIVVSFVVVVVGVVAFRQRVFPFVDRSAALIVFCASMVVLADALVVRHFRTPFEDAMAFQRFLTNLLPG